MAKDLAKTAVIAALYAALTIFLAPISYGLMQVRVSEALCVLAVLTPAAVPGLTVGCFLANILGPNGIWDVVLGTLATLIGVTGMYLMRKKPYIAPICNVLSNGLIVGFELWFIYGLSKTFWVAFGWVSLGELISCFVLGIPLLRYLQKHQDRLGL